MQLRFTALLFLVHQVYTLLKEDDLLDQLPNVVVRLYHAADGAPSIDVGIMDDLAAAE